MLREMIEERRASQISSYNDMLDNLLNSDESTKLKLADDQIIDLIITLIYSGYETMSTTSMMAIKYLHDHPKALLELRVIYIYTSFNFILSMSLSFFCSPFFNLEILHLFMYREKTWKYERGSLLIIQSIIMTTNL